MLDEKLARLEKARDWSPRLVSKFENHLCNADDDALYPMNPLLFAAEKNLAEHEAVDLFLHATKLGLIEINWSLMCPICCDSVDRFTTLKDVHSHFHCTFCNLSTEADLDELIHITFTVAPSLRRIAYHDPDALSPEDYHFKYRFHRTAALPDGTRFAHALRQATMFVVDLEPGETKIFNAIEVRPQILQICDVPHGAATAIQFAQGDETTETVHIRFLGQKIEVPKMSLQAGTKTFVFENSGTARARVIAVCVPLDYEPHPLTFGNVLTGKRLLNSQTFRDLFRSEVIERAEGLSVRDMTILFTDLKGSTALYTRIGDMKAFSLVRQHFDHLGNVVVAHNGAIVKTIGDAVMASFLNPLDALRAALDMLATIEAFNRGLASKEIILKIGIHKGTSIAVTLNDRLDYFGQTVNIAARVQGLASAEEICITNEVSEFPGVKQLLSGFKVTAEKAQLKGLQEEVSVYRLAHRAVAAQA